MPKPYPVEFREDVIRVARQRESGVTLEQVAKDFGIHPMTLSTGLTSHIAGFRARVLPNREVTFMR